MNSKRRKTLKTKNAKKIMKYEFERKNKLYYCSGRRSESEPDTETRQEELEFCHVTMINIISIS